MNELISSIIWQVVLLLFLAAKDRADKEKGFLAQQHWTAFSVFCLIMSINLFRAIEYYIASYQTRWALSFSLYKYFSILLYGFMVLAIVIFFTFNKKNVSVLMLPQKNRPKLVMWGLVTAVLSYCVYWLLAISIGVDVVDPVPNIRQLTNTFDYILFLTISIGLGPILEETLYRGIVYPAYRRKYGQTGAIIFSTLIFSISHFEITIDSVLIGICLALLYEKTENLLAPIIAHSTYNLLWMVTQLYLMSR